MKEEIQKRKFKQYEDVVHKKYKIHSLLGEGSNSKVCSIFFEKESSTIFRAIKFENQRVKHPQIPIEITVLKSIFKSNEGSFQYELGFPKIYEYGNENQYNYLVMEIYGPNLGQLLKICSGKFSFTTAFLVGLQIIDRIEVLHENNFLYIDFKPENFLSGLGSQTPYIIMIDFGKCIAYRSKKTNTHIPYKNSNYLYDPIFSSINSHYDIHPSRRDDIESFMYLLVFLCKGKLPWKVNESKNKKEQCTEILEFKRKITVESLTKQMPIEICDMIQYARSLNFFEKPDYDYLRKKLLMALETVVDMETFSPHRFLYDWQTRDQVDYALYRETPGIKFEKTRETQEEIQSARSQEDDEEGEDQEEEEDISER